MRSTESISNSPALFNSLKAKVTEDVIWLSVPVILDNVKEVLLYRVDDLNQLHHKIQFTLSVWKDDDAIKLAAKDKHVLDIPFAEEVLNDAASYLKSFSANPLCACSVDIIESSIRFTIPSHFFRLLKSAHLSFGSTKSVLPFFFYGLNDAVMNELHERRETTPQVNNKAM